MLKPVDNARPSTRLADMGVVRVQGADAVKFLQGQVSNDVERLTAERSVLAGLHNAQGRAIAVLRLVLAAPEEILALVPKELAPTVVARLSKFVLRAKVKIADVSPEWEIAGVVADGEVAEGMAAASVGAARRDEEGRVWVCVAVDGEAAMAARAPSQQVPTSRSRWLVASKAAPLHVGSPRPSLPPYEWHALDIAAGIPEVVAATTESFVAQMLNLDLVDGVAFDKGCYTGQEVIARAHYRGKVKRRMQRFRTVEPANLTAGDSGALSDGRHFKVVTAVQLSDGRSEFLAVAPMTSTPGVDDEAQPAQGASATSAPPLNAEALPLPYDLPS